MGDTWPKKYSSVITTIGVIDDVVSAFTDKDDFLKQCQNRSVFSQTDLEDFWNNHRYNLKVLKFVYVKSLSRRLTLDWLQQHGMVEQNQGPRPFARITDEQFNLILRESGTKLYM